MIECFIRSILFSKTLGVIQLEKLLITGPTNLKGEVTINGAKNAAVAILPDRWYMYY